MNKVLIIIPCFNEKDNIEALLKDVNGILVAGNPTCDADLDEKEISSMIKAVTWARLNKKPFLGICFGLHVMTIEWARNVLNTKNSVITKEKMRLGANETINEEGSHVFAAYGEKKVTERHRHCFEFNNQYRDEMIKSGLKLTSFTADGTLVESIEWPHAEYPWGVGVQYHPEYKSKPMAPSPLFKKFIKRCQASE